MLIHIQVDIYQISTLISNANCIAINNKLGIINTVKNCLLLIHDK